MRHFLGYERLGTVAQTLALNRACNQMGIYYNLFQPAMGQVAKETAPEAGPAGSD